MIQDEDFQFISRYSQPKDIDAMSPAGIINEYNKRDRPLSSYFDSPFCSKSVKEPEDLTSCSPLLNRKPFKSISNFVFPNMKKKLSSSTKSLSRSMTQVAKCSQFFGNNYSCDNDFNNIDQQPISICKNDLDHLEIDNNKGSPIQQKTNRSIRRIHSMYQTTKEKQNYFMEDNSHLSNTSIRTFKVVNDLLPRINEDELIRILKGNYNHEFEEFIIIDCRFNYEFDGGHIDGAINISGQKELEERFFTNPANPELKKQLLIFHCEFSSCRGPNMASHLRRCDRKLNSHNYPKLSYPDIVILAGGYKKFFDKYKNYCNPLGYIEMNDIKFQETCESEMDKVRQANKLTRARSYNHFVNDRSKLGNHIRSYSYTTSHTENSKILKRQRSSSKSKDHSSTASVSKLEFKLSRAKTFSYDQSIHNSSPVNDSSIDEDFQPPFAFFKSNYKKSHSLNANNLSSSSISINSSSSSICSDSAFSSTDSLTDAYSSPVGEFNEYFESKSTNLTNYLKTNPNNSFASLNNNNNNALLKPSVLNPMLRKPTGPVPQPPNRSMPNAINNNNTGFNNTIINQYPTNLPSSSFKFPSSNSLKLKSSRHSLNRINTSSRSCFSTPLVHSSSIVSSPLSTTTLVSTVDSKISNNTSSIIDPINDTPVDFTVPFTTRSHNRHINHSRKRSGSLLSSAGGGLHNFVSLDIDEIDEEKVEDDDNEDTLAEIKLSKYMENNPFK